MEGSALEEEQFVAEDDAQVENALVVLAHVDLEAQVENVENPPFILPQVENVEAQEEVEFGPHNIANVRGRRKRRPFTLSLSPRSQAIVNEGKARKAAA